MALEAPGTRGPSDRPGRLFLGELLTLHVRPDPLGHLRGADGLVAHDVLEGVAAALEVDRVATERRLLRLRHPVSSSLSRAVVEPLARRLRLRAGGMMTALRGEGKGKIHSVGVAPRGKNYRVGVYPLGGRTRLSAG